MSLSNTATPKYYKAFRDSVLRGEIAICREIEMQMNRIESLIRNPAIFYDDTAVEGWVAFCENEMTLADGRDVTLLDSFKLWGEDLFGWYYYTEVRSYSKKLKCEIKRVVKKRLINKQYLVIARGAAKSMYEAYIQAYWLTINTKTTDQITLAPTMRQADEVMAPIRTSIIRSRGPLFRFMTEGSLQNTTGSKANRQKLSSTKNGIENFLTGSVLRVVPMTTEKVQGYRGNMATIDEWLSCDIKDDIIGPIEQGASKNDDYIILAVSSEGTIRNGIGDSIKMELMSILRGDYEAPHVSIWYYKLDDIKEVSNPDMWIKANPNIGVTVSYETYMLDVERAEKAPGARNDILAKRFNIPMEGTAYFFPYEETLPHEHADFWGMPCSLGMDMSQGDDFCAFTFMFPLPNGSFGIKTRSYISSLTYDRLLLAMREKYNHFINEDSLVVMDGTVLDMMRVYDDLDQYIIDNHLDIRSVGYDPYNAREFIERWERENGPYAIEKVIQGAKTETVPLGELKKLSEERMLIFDQELMSFAMGNAIAIEDTNGNRKLCKKRREEKIDNVAAMLDAYVAYKAHKDDFE